jgi:hypothetical protein
LARFGCQQEFRPCASAFAKPLSLLFNRSYVTPIFKKGRRNNVEDYRGQAILYAIPKCFELKFYRGMYNDLKTLMSIVQHGFMKNRSTITNLLEYASFVVHQLRTAIYTDFSKAFDRVRDQLLLNEMSVCIEPARCMWLGILSVRENPEN